MNLTLNSLDLNERRLKAARDEIRRNAYFKWEAAGRPEGDPLRFWHDAECEWIEFQYVPDRLREEIDEAERLDALQSAHTALQVSRTHELVAS